MTHPIREGIETILRDQGVDDPSAEINSWFTVKVCRVAIRKMPDGGFDVDVTGNCTNELLRREIGRAIRREIRERAMLTAEFPVPHPRQIADLLHLATGICPTSETRDVVAAEVATWSAERRFAASRWALAQHAYAFHDQVDLLLPELPYVRELEERMGQAGAA